MKKAAIDIGTNSARLLIADVCGNKIERIEKITTITRLGKGVDKNRRLSSEAIEKNIEVLKNYRSIAYSYGIRSIKAIATSAVRDALNRDEFINAVKERAAIDVEVISGGREAELGFRGASSVVEGKPCTVIDIGGGSTEFIYGAHGDIEISKSIDVGAVRITEKFFGEGTMDNRAISAAAGYIWSMAEEIIKNIKHKGNFETVGIGGTITSLAAIDMGLTVYDANRVHGYKLGKAEVDSIFSRLSSISLEDRKCIPGLQAERADIIPAGALILKVIMEGLGVQYIIVSEHDNLEGLYISSDSIKNI